MAQIVIGLSAVIVAVTDEQPRVLTVNPAEQTLATRDLAIETAGGSFGALPFGPLHPSGDRTMELGLRSWVRQQTALELGYVEQLYTFGDRDRLAPLGTDSPRVISVAYLALVREGDVAGGAARWRNVYDFLPWEDGRSGRVGALPASVSTGLDRWTERADHPARSARRERIDLCFGRSGASWDPDRVLDRYELLYESRLLAGRTDSGLGEPMALDHRRILATALGRLRGKIRYRPVVFELLPPTFTLFQLQRLVEALAGFRLHKQNFRRLVSNAGLVEGTGRFEAHTGGRPAELFRFRREVLRERLAPGVGRPNPLAGP